MSDSDDLDISDIENVKADWEITYLGFVEEDPRPKVEASWREVNEAYALNERITRIMDLRKLADFLQFNPNLPMPSIESEAHEWDEKEFLNAASKIKGPYEKDYTDTYFRVKKPISNTLTYSICTYRETVCEKKVVGQEEVEEYDYSNVPRIKVKKDIIEWSCEPVSLKSGGK